ncbi:MAG: DUF2975 domain-containing protein [Alteromonadaceae bacterium]|nr:DUF2975 domain-containing protein [Alteromonadaceae bacterium]
MNKISKVSKVSQFIKVLLLFIAGMQLCVYLILFLFGTTTGSVSEVSFNYLGMSSSIHVSFDSSWQGLAQALAEQHFNPVFILGIADSIPYLLMYFFLYKLFSLYQQGLVFTEVNVKYIKNIALVFFAWIAMNVFYPVLVVFILRLSGIAEDPLPLIINLGSTELRYFVIGAIIYVMAWIMSEAIALQQEQELVI